MTDDLPNVPTREERIAHAKRLARKLVDELESDDLQKLFDFADAQWPFDHGLKMAFFDEIHAALVEQREAKKMT